MKYASLLYLLLCTSCYSAVYMQQDSGGDISYSDTPSSNAKAVELPTVNSVPSHQTAQASSNTKLDTSQKTATKSKNLPPVKPEDRVPYTEFEIISPKDQETIQNQPSVPIEVRIKPDLQPGDQIILLVDGKITGDPSTSTQLSLGEIERGTHQINALLLDNNGQVLKQSNAITLFFHRNSVITSPASQAPPRPRPPLN